MNDCIGYISEILFTDDQASESINLLDVLRKGSDCIDLFWLADQVEWDIQ